MAEFQDKLGKLQKALTATQEAATEAGTRLDSIKRAIDATPSPLAETARDRRSACSAISTDINLALNGDRIWRAHNEGVPASISEHMQAAGSPDCAAPPAIPPRPRWSNIRSPPTNWRWRFRNCAS